jgi:hypothetical protein
MARSASSRLDGALAAAALALVSCQAHALEWTPIPGIPEPAFGVEEDVPSLPSPWDQEVAAFYYVCASCAGAGSVTYGTPSSPRRTLPDFAGPGSIVVLAGTYDESSSVRFSCSAEEPCFLVGDTTNPARSVNEIDIDGSYLIIDNVEFALRSGVSGSTIGIRGDHVALRNSKVTGTPSAGGLGIDGTNMVVMNNQIVDNGDANASGDQDRHGIKVGSNNTWIIGNELARNSGDGVQVGDVGTRGFVYSIYIGGNTAHDNKQTGIWVKEARDVIISSNESYGHMPSGSSDGEGLGGQYDAQYVWMLFNNSHDNYAGIGFKSSNSGDGSNFYVIGNYIYDNVNTGFRSDDVWESSAIASWNSADLTIVNNTLDGNSGGINLNGNTGAAYVYNNSVKNLLAPGAQALHFGDELDVQYEGFNAFGTQPVVDAGTAPIAEKNPYAIFLSRYGINIQVDIEGRLRPLRQWDIGAFEQDAPLSVRPKPPGSLLVQ